MLMGRIWILRSLAVASATHSSSALTLSAGYTMTARRDREPMACLKSSTLILTISRVERFTPVRFPPGRSQLEMSPVAPLKVSVVRSAWCGSVSCSTAICLHCWRRYLRTGTYSSQNDWQYHSQTQGEEPQGRRGRADRAAQTSFAGGDAWIESEPIIMITFQEQKHQCCRCTIEQMTNEFGKRGACRCGCPSERPAQQDREKGQRTEEPPHQSIQHAPHHARTHIRRFTLEQYPVTHADGCANNQMHQEAQHW